MAVETDQNSSLPEGIILPKNPSGNEGVTIAAGMQNGEAAAEVSVEKNLGKGWTAGGGWQWVKDQGHKAMGFLTWRPRSQR